MAKKDELNIETAIAKASPELKEAITKMMATKTQADLVANDLMLIKVTDDGSLSIATQQLSNASKMVKLVEDKRKAIKEPYLETCKLIDGIAKTISENLEKGIVHVKSQVLDFDKIREEEKSKANAELEEKLAEEEAKRNAENEKNEKILNYINVTLSEWIKNLYAKCDTVEYAQKVKTILQTQFPADDKFGNYVELGHSLRDQYLSLLELRIENLSQAENISEEQKAILKEKEEMAELHAKLAEKERKIKAIEEQEQIRLREEEARRQEEELRAAQEAEQAMEATAGMRSTWKFELVDKDKLCSAWIAMDEVAVKAYLKEKKDELKDGSIINGVRFFKEKTVVAK